MRPPYPPLTVGQEKQNPLCPAGRIAYVYPPDKGGRGVMFPTYTKRQSPLLPEKGTFSTTAPSFWYDPYPGTSMRR